jgi:hypothetical protein
MFQITTATAPVTMPTTATQLLPHKPNTVNTKGTVTNRYKEIEIKFKQCDEIIRLI